MIPKPAHKLRWWRHTGVSNMLYFDWLAKDEAMQCWDQRQRWKKVKSWTRTRFRSGWVESSEFGGWFCLNKSPLNIDVLLPLAGGANQRKCDIRELSRRHEYYCSCLHVISTLDCDVTAVLPESFRHPCTHVRLFPNIQHLDQTNCEVEEKLKDEAGVILLSLLTINLTKRPKPTMC